MKIGAISTYALNHKPFVNFEGNRSQPVNLGVVTDKSHNCNISFSPIVSSNVSKINFGSAIKLPFKNGYRCPCCGIKMLDKKVFMENINNILGSPSSASIIKKMKHYKKSFTRVEKSYYKKMRNISRNNPNIGFEKIVSTLGTPPSYIRQMYHEYASMPAKTKSEHLINYLDTLKPNMHAVELEVFKEVKSVNQKHPQNSLRDVLFLMRDSHMKKLQLKQLSVVSGIQNLSEKLSGNSRISMDEFLNYEKKLISQNDGEFKIKQFRANLYNILSTFPEKERFKMGKEMFEEAGKLPGSSDDASAFIVKYSGFAFNKALRKEVPRSEEEIATRFVSRAFPTLEHIVPKSPISGPKGETVDSNLIYECARCNNERGSMPFYQYIPLKYPEMPANAQKAMDKIIEDINMNSFDEDFSHYPAAVAKTFRKVSTIPNVKGAKPLIDLDISALNLRTGAVSEKTLAENLVKMFNIDNKGKLEKVIDNKKPSQKNLKNLDFSA